MKNHSLNHFKDKLNSIAPPESLVTPFPCPEGCKDPKDPTKPKGHRDKVTFQRHFAFQHRKIYEFCSPEDLLGEELDDEDVKQDVTKTPSQSIKIEKEISPSKRPASASTKISKKKQKQEIKEEIEVNVDPVALQFEEDDSVSKDSETNI